MNNFERKYEFEGLNEEAAMLGSWRRRVDLLYRMSPLEIRDNIAQGPAEIRELEAREFIANINHTLIESTTTGKWLDEITSVRQELLTLIQPELNQE